MRDVAVFSDDNSSIQALAKEIGRGSSHRYGRFPSPNDEYSFIVAQIIATVSDDEKAPLTLDVAAYGRSWLNGTE